MFLQVLSPIAGEMIDDDALTDMCVSCRLSVRCSYVQVKKSYSIIENAAALIAERQNLRMACSDTKPKREFKSTALKKLSDIFQGFVDSLAEETSFNSVLDVVGNRDHKRELTYRLNIVENLVKSIREQVPHIQDSLTVCDEILSLACGKSASQEDVVCAPRRGSDVGVGGASNPNAEFKAVYQRRARPRRRGNTCRHFCSHHQEVMDRTLWRKLPREMVQHVCAFLPFFKLLELQKLCKPPWSRMPMATNFRQFCDMAHDDLFGILITDYNFESYRIAVSNSMHTEWFDLEIKDMPTKCFGWNDTDKDLFAHDGGLVCILPSHFERFEYLGESPSIFVFNPLTGDQRDIPLSSFTCSKDKNYWKAILLHLKVDSETGCYDLVLVTQSGKYSRGGKVYRSERYDSKSKLWSTLDSGFVFGDGVVNHERCEVYFDCCSNQLCRFDGQPFQDGAFARLESYPESLTFVRDHRFGIDYIDHIGADYRESRLLEMTESVWENGWLTRSTKRFPMEEPPDGLPTRLFASRRYVLVVADDVPSDVFEHRHQRMLLFDRKTREAAYDIPNFWRENDVEKDGAEFLDRKVHVMCDLKWNVVP